MRDFADFIAAALRKVLSLKFLIAVVLGIGALEAPVYFSHGRDAYLHAVSLLLESILSSAIVGTVVGALMRRGWAAFRK